MVHNLFRLNLNWARLDIAAAGKFSLQFAACYLVILNFKLGIASVS